MAEPRTETPLSLSEQYHLKEKEDKPDVASKSSVTEVIENVVSSINGKVKEIAPSSGKEESSEPPATASDESTQVNAAVENTAVDSPVSTEESHESNEECSVDAEEAPEIKLETAPADFRFPTTNQTRHCFTLYIEYHRCVAAKGEDAEECGKFAKYYRALCPGEWVERWNEQRENGTFPGPL